MRKISNNSQMLAALWPISRGLLWGRQREFWGALIEFTALRWWVGGRRTDKHEQISVQTWPFPRVQGKEKNKLQLVSSVYSLGKRKSWQPTLVPETIFEILLQCKVTIWELARGGSLAPSPQRKSLTSLSVFLPGSCCCFLGVLLLKRRLASVRDLAASRTFFLI